MNLIGEVLRELLGMFLADAGLTSATLLLVGAVAALVVRFDIDPAMGGALLLLGSLSILVESALREARRRRRP